MTGPKYLSSRYAVLFLVVAPALAGCGSLSDFSLKDQEWFARPSRMFSRSIAIETPPLTPTKPITPEDLVSAEGACPGMPAAPADANASAEGGPAAPPAPTGSVALGHTECDVVRGIGIAPDSVNLSRNERGERVALITYLHGPRPGAYTFTAGRLTSIERVNAPEPEKKPAKSTKHKRKT